MFKGLANSWRNSPVLIEKNDFSIKRYLYEEIFCPIVNFVAEHL